MGFDNFGSFSQAGSSIFDTAMNIGSGIYNIFNSERNNARQTQAKNWAYADSRAANHMLNYFLTHGDVDGFRAMSLNQDYDDVADYLNPFLSLNSLELSKQAQKLSEDQFKYNKYVTENSAQIRMEDYKKAGVSPLLVSGSSASYSPVSFSGGASVPVGKNRPTPQNIASLNYQSGLASLVSNLRLTDAQIGNIKADTALKNADANLRNSQIETENTKPALNKANTDYLIGQLENLPSIRMLTQNQMQYYIEQVLDMQYERDRRFKYNLGKNDSTPDDVKYMNFVVNSLGIDPNSSAGQSLVSVGLATSTVINMISRGLLKVK